MSFDIPYQMRQLASSLPFPYYKRQTTLLQTFGIPEISQTFYPFYKKCNETSKYLLNYRFLNSKINEFYLELEVLTKYVTVMLLIVLAEAALR
jgi:hypothetical protein